MATSGPKYRCNPEPRLSANQLAEYLKATPSRRKGIIKEAKFPKTSVVAQYKGARDGISKYVCSPIRDQKILLSAIDALTDREAKSTATEWTRDDSRRSIEAVQTFQAAANAMGIDKIDCKPVVGSVPKLNIGGVEISVSIDASTHKPVKGADHVGSVILLFSKASDTSGKSRAERCRCTAVLAYLLTREHLSYLGEADPKICFAVDVLQGNAYNAPSSYKMLLSNMLDSCEEICLRWPGTMPPDDYDGPPLTP